jgi:hypothetical protein
MREHVLKADMQFQGFFYGQNSLNKIGKAHTTQKGGAFRLTVVAMET